MKEMRRMTNNNSLLILGLGQYGKLAKEIAESMKKFEKIDLLDDKEDTAVGKIDDYERFVNDYSFAFVAIGASELRLELMEKLEQAGYEIATLVSEGAFVSPSAKVEKGCAVEPMAVIHTGAVLEKGCLVSSGAVVNHFAICREGVHVDCNAVVIGSAVVGKCITVESGEVYGK